MTDEERQGQMDFILNQQAQFASDIQKLQEAQARGEAHLDRSESVVRLMLRAGLRARREMREQGARITTLVDSQIRAEEITRRNSEDIGQLAGIVRQLVSRQNGDESDRKS